MYSSPQSDEEYPKLGDFQAIKPFGKAIYAPDQGSLASAMMQAYKRIEASINQWVASKS